MENSRPHIAEYNIGLAYHVATRSTCLRRKVGAVAIKNNRLIASGTNGAVSGTPHCLTCIRNDRNIPSGTDLNTCFGIHAEQNLLTQAATFGLSLSGSSVYVTNQPCFTCIKLLAGIKPKAIIYKDIYPDDMTQEFISKAKWFTAEYLLPSGSMLTVIRPDESFSSFNSLFRGEE